MFHIRTTKTSSLATAVQIVQYKNRKMVIVKHIGSAHADAELKKLKETAANWIEKEINSRLSFRRKRSHLINITSMLDSVMV